MEARTHQHPELTQFESNIKLAKLVKKHGCRIAPIPQEFHSRTSPHQVEAAFLLSNKDSHQQISTVRQIQVATQVIKRTIQAIERFLINTLQRPYQPISPASLQRLAPCLLNFHFQLPEEDVITFLCFLKGTYGLGVCYSSEYFASRLELAMMTTVKKLPLGPVVAEEGEEKVEPSEGVRAKKGKEPEKSPGSRNLFKRETETDKLNQVWSEQMQVRLLSLIQQNEFFLKIRDILRKQFPKFQEIITTESLKNRYYKVLRAALKQLKLLQQRVEDLPEMEHLTDGHIKFVLRSNEGHQARRRLVELYTMPRGPDHKIEVYARRAAQAINDCLD